MQMCTIDERGGGRVASRNVRVASPDREGAIVAKLIVFARSWCDRVCGWLLAIAPSQPGDKAGVEGAQQCEQLSAAGQSYLEVVALWLRECRPVGLVEDDGRIPWTTTYDSDAQLPEPAVEFPVDGNASWQPGGHAYPAVDIFAAAGTPVVSPVDGVVEGLSRDDTWDREPTILPNAVACGCRSSGPINGATAALTSIRSIQA